MIKNSTVNCFVPCLPGLEKIVERELQDCFLQNFRKEIPCVVEAGGVNFPGTSKRIYAANLWLRSANRVLIRIGEFNAAQFSQLTRRIAQLPWQEFISRKNKVVISVNSRKSRLNHSVAITERCQSGIEKALGFSPEFDAFANAAPTHQRIFVRLYRDRCFVSIDSSGEHLHRRGYRQAVAKAPLRETLAAGIVAASNWAIEESLIDPFCGSGTIVIEAAMRAANIAPGLLRDFAFRDWVLFDDAEWTKLLDRAEAVKTVPAAGLYGFDRDAGAIATSLENAKRAGVSNFVDFRQQAISGLAPESDQGVLVTNLPYGQRIGNVNALRDLYAQFGQTCRQRLPGWRVYFLCNRFELATASGWKQLKTVGTFDNGGIKVMLVHPSGSKNRQN